jgi:flavin reductase (DIM6/NTAB) family NADH-FMN oxidoreductase RutF
MHNLPVTFRDAMSLIPTSVSILACISDSKIYSCTISSLVSVDVSEASAQIIFVLKKKSFVGSKIVSSNEFTINVLNSSQTPLAKKYSSQRNSDDLLSENWDTSTGRFTQLKHARVVLKCKFECVYKAHKADIFVANVLDFDVKSEVNSLIYDSRRYGMFGTV